jgi:hypothetical protein
MPPLSELRPPLLPPARKLALLALLALRSYLAVAAVLVVAKIVRLALA